MKQLHIDLSDKHWIRLLLPLLLPLMVYLLQDTLGGITNSIAEDMYNIRKEKDISGFFESDNGKFVETLMKTVQNQPTGEPLAGFDPQLLKHYFVPLVTTAPSAAATADMPAPLSQAAPQPAQMSAPVYTLNMVFIGNQKRFAVIDGITVREGDALPTGEVVTRLEQGRVQVKGAWGERWITVGR